MDVSFVRLGAHMESELGAVDWPGLVAAVSGKGWVRLEGIVNGRTCARLAGAAPGMWSVIADVPGTPVHQDGLSCGARFDETTRDVRRFGLAICESINAARGAEWQPLPCFN